jgi:hypothetical protein
MTDWYPVIVDDEQAKYTGFELQRGEWVAMYCNVGYAQTQHDQRSDLRWVRNDDCTAVRRPKVTEAVNVEDLAQAMDAAYWKARGSTPRGIKHEWGINAEKRRCWIEAARIALERLK